MSSVSSASNGNAAYYASQKNMFSKLDTDQDGKLTENEFVAGRPKDVSESQASKLYSKIDTTGSGALTEDQFDEGMDSDRPSMGLTSLLSGDAMAVLMLMSQQGGMAFNDGAGGSGGQPPSASDIYAGMDTDSDGSVTQAEFISARPDGMSEDDAKTLYSEIDTEGTGSITEEQFADSMKAQSAGGGRPHGGGGAPSSDEVYDALDTNKDGVVSEDEFLAGSPAGVTTDQATAAYNSIDTEGTGSITREQFSNFMNPTNDTDSVDLASGQPFNLAKGINDLLDILKSLSPDSDSETMETEAA